MMPEGPRRVRQQGQRCQRQESVGVGCAFDDGGNEVALG